MVRSPQLAPATNAVFASQQNVVGALMIGARYSDVARIVRINDYCPELRPIISAIEQLAAEGKPHDVIAVARQLADNEHLKAVGDIAALSKLARETVNYDNAPSYARIVRDQADVERMRRADDRDFLAVAQAIVLERLKGEAPSRPPIVLRHVADIVEERREAQWLAGTHKILERGVLAVLAGSRNTFKSFIALHWAMLAALEGEPVLILSGEGAGLDRRVDAWMRTYAPAKNLSSLSLWALERAVNLNANDVRNEVRDAIDTCKFTPALIVIDTFSKFAPGLDENDNAEVALYLSTLGCELREHYGSTVLLVAHAGHADAKRPRGASALMANPDAEYIVERPSPADMTATVTRERFKDSPPLPPLAYSAEVVNLGRVDSYDESVTSLVMREVDSASVIVAHKPELRGKAQRQLLAALRAHTTDGVGIWTLQDMREIGRKAGMHRNSARSAAEALTFCPHLTPTVGGWRLTECMGPK
jgi:hypothetical protein